jgi:hypothetical protein
MEKKTRRNFVKALGASVGAAGVLGSGSHSDAGKFSIGGGLCHLCDPCHRTV